MGAMADIAPPGIHSPLGVLLEEMALGDDRMERHDAEVRRCILRAASDYGAALAELMGDHSKRRRGIAIRSFPDADLSDLEECLAAIVRRSFTAGLKRGADLAERFAPFGSGSGAVATFAEPGGEHGANIEAMQAAWFSKVRDDLSSRYRDAFLELAGSTPGTLDTKGNAAKAAHEATQSKLTLPLGFKAKGGAVPVGSSKAEVAAWLRQRLQKEAKAVIGGSAHGAAGALDVASSEAGKLDALKKDGRIRAVEFKAVIDQGTTPVCGGLDGAIMDIRDADVLRYTPPLHYGCRSSLVPATIDAGSANWDITRSVSVNDQGGKATYSVKPREIVPASGGGTNPPPKNLAQWIRRGRKPPPPPKGDPETGATPEPEPTDPQGPQPQPKAQPAPPKPAPQPTPTPGAAAAGGMSIHDIGGPMPTTVEGVDMERAMLIAARAAHKGDPAFYKKATARLAHLNAKKKKLLAKHGGADAPKVKVKAAPKVVLPKPKHAPSAPEAAQAPSAGQPLKAELMQQVGPQGGSNPGALYEDSKGRRYYVKNTQGGTGGNVDEMKKRAQNEKLTAELYREMGYEAPEVTLAERDGKPAVASKIIDGVQLGKKLDPKKVQDVGEGMVADAYLANWDAVGMTHDNMGVKNGKAVRLDTGGGLLYRAQGKAKGAAFGTKVTELETLRNASMNPSAAAQFKDVTDEQILKGMDRVLAVKPERLDALVEKHGPGTATEKIKLAKQLKARRADIQARRNALAKKIAHKAATKVVTQPQVILGAAVAAAKKKPTAAKAVATGGAGGGSSVVFPNHIMQTGNYGAVLGGGWPVYAHWKSKKLKAADPDVGGFVRIKVQAASRSHFDLPVGTWYAPWQSQKIRRTLLKHKKEGEALVKGSQSFDGPPPIEDTTAAHFIARRHPKKALSAKEKAAYNRARIDWQRGERNNSGVRAFTGGSYSAMRKVQRGKTAGMDPGTVSSMESKVRAFDRAADAAPKFVGETHRSFRNLPRSEYDRLFGAGPGGIYEVEAYESSSKSERFAKRWGNWSHGDAGGGQVKVLLHTRATGRGGIETHQISQHSSEQEVTFRAGTKVQITRIVDHGDGRFEVWGEETF